ncbi:hypothetical protein ACFU53_44065, partial [Streptomyces sp. NPDC057474]
MNPIRLLVVTAVDAERDAVARGLGPTAPVRCPGLPGREMIRINPPSGSTGQRVTCGPLPVRHQPLSADLVA